MVKYQNVEEAAGWLAVVDSVEQAQAQRHGVSVGTVRCLAQVAALRSTGASVGTADLVRAGLGHVVSLRQYVSACCEQGWLVRVGGIRGSIELTPTGRAVLTDYNRAWRRAQRQLVSFEPVVVYGRPSQP